jgi:CheY-like chemotaxis protein
LTPRQADVAYVLESVPGFVALFALSGVEAWDFAVEIESARHIAQAHYALVRRLDQAIAARVLYLHSDRKLGPLAARATLLELRAHEREAARRRVSPMPPLAVERIVVERVPSKLARVLVADEDPSTRAVFDELLATCVAVQTVEDAVAAASSQPFDLIVCDTKLAFGRGGLLARLPLEIARRVYLVAEPVGAELARSRLEAASGPDARDRVVTKPLDAATFGRHLVASGAVKLDVEVKPVATTMRRNVRTPAAGEPFTVLLTGVDDDVHEALRRVFREDARHIVRPDPADAAELALARPLHAIVCGADAALHPKKSVLRAIAAEDPAGAARAIVVAPARDVPYVKHKLAAMKLANEVLPLPIDDAMLARAIFRDHPELLARAAVAEASRVAAEPSRAGAVLVVDDDRTTEILLAAAEMEGVTLATNAMQAFEHVTSRPVDLLVASATLRGDGGEPLYRTLWRMKPELKARTVLVAPADAMPASHPRRVVQRPLTREVLAAIRAASIR